MPQARRPIQPCLGISAIVDAQIAARHLAGENLGNDTNSIADFSHHDRRGPRHLCIAVIRPAGGCMSS